MMLSEQELLEQAKYDVKTCWDALSGWRERARKGYRFEAGDQWDENDRKRLRDDLKRACFTFNRVKPLLNAVVGMEIGNRQEVKCTAREPNDNGASTVFDLSMTWLRDLCGLAVEESDAFRDMLISGVGCTSTAMDYSEGRDGKILTERFSPLDAFWDTNASRRNIVDARVKGRLITFSEAEFTRRFPRFETENASSSVFGISLDNIDGTQPHNNDPKRRYTKKAGSSPERMAKNILVAQYEYCLYEPKYYVSNPLAGDAIEEYDEEKFTEIRQGMEQNGFIFYERGVAGPPDEGIPIAYVKLDHKKWYRAYFTGEHIIDSAVSPDPHRGTLHFITGSREEKTGYFIGLLESAIEPQMLLNKIISAMVDIFNFGSKGQLMFETGAFVNPDAAQKDFSRFDRMIELSPGGKDLLYERDPVELPSSAAQIVQLAIDGLPAATGVPWESIGITNKDQPGILEQTRKQSAMAALSTYFDALKAYRVEAARTQLWFVQQYIDAPTLARICGANATPEGIAASKQVDVLTYDIVVGDAPNSPNQRDAVLKVWMDVLQYDQSEDGPAALLWPDMIPYLPLPEPLLQRMQERADQRNQPSPEEEIAKQVALQQAIADIKKTLAEAEAAEAKARAADSGTEIKAMKLDFDRFKAQLDFIEGMAANMVKAKEKKNAGRD